MAQVPALYARFSSELQNPRSCEAQLEELRMRLARDGYDASKALVFKDDAISGVKWERPGLQGLLGAIALGRVSAVYVESPDRLSRDAEDMARLTKLFEFSRVPIVALNGASLDGSSASALTFGIMGLLGQNYLRELGQKTRRGLRDAAREGRSTGSLCFGYRTNPQTKRHEVHAEEAEILREIFELCASGLSNAAIATLLNQRRVAPPRGKRRAGDGWMGSAIREQLRNRRYIGEVVFGRLEYARHPDTRKRTARRRPENEITVTQQPELAIIPRELWNRVAARLAALETNFKKPRAERTGLRSRSDYLLSGILRCGVCGGLMEVMAGSSARYYACSSARKRGTCGNRMSLREDLAKETISEAILELTWNPETLLQARQKQETDTGAGPRALEKRLAATKARLARHEERARKLLDMQLEGDTSPTVAEARKEAESRALAERVQVDELVQALKAPRPAPEFDWERAICLSDVFEAKGPDVAQARERLRGVLGNEPVFLHPDRTADGQACYRAEAGFLPFALLSHPNAATPLGYHERRRPLVVARAGFEPTTFGL